MSDVLLIGASTDSHIQVLSWALKSRVIPFTIWDTRCSGLNAQVSVELDINGALDSNIINGSDYKSAWLRTVYLSPPVDMPAKLSPEDREYVCGEHVSIVSNILSFYSQGNMHWVNPYPSTIIAESKLAQINACRELAIPFPSTLISNNPKKIRSFCQHYGRMVVKPFEPHFHTRPNGSRTITYANIINYQEICELTDEQLFTAVAIYQEVINKGTDLRVTKVGDSYFGCLMRCTNNDCIDYRRYQLDKSLKYSYIEVPQLVRQYMERLTGHFGLEFASSDFCFNEHGEPIFLDLNPGGAFLFVEYYAYGRAPIVASLCSLLTGQPVEFFPGLHEFNRRDEL